MRLIRWVRNAFAGDSNTPAAPASPTTRDHVDEGRRALKLGDHDRAVRAFTQAVADDPGSAESHVNLAFALQEQGHAELAVVHLQRASTLDPGSFDACYMLGCAAEAAGDLDEAILGFRRAVALRPDFELARMALCRVLALHGRTAEARVAIEAALAAYPDNADFHHYLGNVAMAEKRSDEAELSYRRALALRPDDVEVHANLGLALHDQKRFDEAATSFDTALALNPALQRAHVHLGITRKAQRRFEDADACLRRAIELDPNDVESVNSLGGVCMDRGLIDQAIEHYAKAAALRPELPGAHGNLGLALYEKGHMAAAVTHYRKALSILPVGDTHDNLAIALLRLGRIDEAVAEFQKAAALKPDDINTQTNLAVALTDAVSQAAGIAAYREILKKFPDQLYAHSNLLFTLSYYDGCSPQQYLDEARIFGAKLPRGLIEPPPAASPLEGRPLRVGFVSGDLHEHPVGFFLEGVVRHLNPGRFELFAYLTANKQDQLSARLRPRFSAWRQIKNLTDEAAARAIRNDRVDVLIDLAGHTGDNRLAVFALRPAPVQVTWLGYFASTGVAEIDYLLADEACVPHGSEQQFSESVWRLPQTRLCFTPPADDVAPPVAPLPAATIGCITFGCFQRFPKINDAVLALWSRVFAALPNARLLLQSQLCSSPLMVERMLVRLAAVGIARDRVATRRTVPLADYLSSYSAVDIVLDTFPYNGGTTTCEALWMGVPTLTLAGDTMIGRQGAALLTAAGLAEWVAEDVGSFVATAVEFAGDLPALARLRSELRQRVKVSPLFDTERFARNLDDALTGIWNTETKLTAN